MLDKVKHLKKDCRKAVRLSEKDAKLIGVLQEKIGIESEGEILRRGIAALAREYKVKVAA